MGWAWGLELFWLLTRKQPRFIGEWDFQDVHQVADLPPDMYCTSLQLEILGPLFMANGPLMKVLNAVSER